MTVPPQGFGVQIACAAMYWPECLEITRAAEESGYAVVWLPDHYVATPDGIDPDPRLPLIDAWSALGALAQASSRVRLGPLVASNTFRHPAVLAKMVASLDHISAGRIEIGMGAGWFDFEHTSFGIPFPPIGERLRALEEAMRVVKALWTEPTVDFAGRYYTLEGAISEPKPLQKPHPPLVVGAVGEKVAMRNAARHADHWNTFCPLSQYPRRVEIFREHCEREGRDFDSITRSVMLPLYLEEDEAVKGKLEKWGGGTPQSREWFLVGSDDEIAERLGRFVEAGAQHVIVQVDRKEGNGDAMRAFVERFGR